MRDSFFARVAHAHRNILAIKLDGATKEEYAWGFRIGFLTFASQGLSSEQYEALEKKVMGMVRATLSSSNTNAQEGLYRTLQTSAHTEEKERFYHILVARYRKVIEVLEQYRSHPRINALPFNSGYFVTLRCRDIDTEALRQRLLQKGIGIVAIDDEHIRVTYSTIDTEDIAYVFREIFATADSDDHSDGDAHR